MANTASSFFDRIKLKAQPMAHPDSQITMGRARFTVLTSRLIRLEWSANGEFEDRATFAFPNRLSELPIFRIRKNNSQLEISTDNLKLHYVDTGSPFDETNLSIKLTVGDQTIVWTPGKVNTGNLRGTRRTLDQCSDAAQLDEGLLSREGWALYDDSGLAVWDNDLVWIEARPKDHLQDWYFFGYGHDYKAALADYRHFGGPTPLIPRFVLGGWWSRFWPYHADDLQQLVDDFQAHDIPLDVLVVDMDWHRPDGWTGYSWNQKLFPDPPAFLAWVHAQALHVTLNLHPADGIQKHEDMYADFAAKVGHETNDGQGIPFTPADKAFMQYYFELLHHPMEDQGVDFWWLDWQQGEASGLPGLDPLPWLNHLHFLDSKRRGMRPMLYSRWGGLGNHRYPIGFSGDTFATWDALRFQTYFTPTAANVGYGWWSHDIGGHFSATDPELYARWVQFGAVSPCLRLHATKDPLAERRPWAFPPAVYEAAKAAFQFRYQLLPYLYSAASTATEQGLSLCYPMYFEFPESDDAYLAREQYFLGDQFFVVPIVYPADPQTGLAAFDVWIPDGTWLEYRTHEIFSGPRWVQLHGDLNRIPMFVKAGAIIPMAPPLMRTKDWDGSHLILVVFPGADGHFLLYEDDGVTEAYQDGQFETTLIHSTVAAHQLVSIDIAAAAGHCGGLPDQRLIEIQLREIDRPNAVTVNGLVNTTWTYDQSERMAIVSLPNANRREALKIAITAADHISCDDSQYRSTAPFVHGLDYNLVEDAGQQFGTIIIVPPGDLSPFGAEIDWTLQKGSQDKITTVKHYAATEQIIHSPFALDDSLEPLYWSVSAAIQWQGKTIHYTHQSQVVQPAINRWQTAIYNFEQEPFAINAFTSDQNNALGHLVWSEFDARHTLNLNQPFGVVLLEDEQQRLLTHEPLEACLSTNLFSLAEQNTALYVQHVGSARCFLNGVELRPTAPVLHPDFPPMFYSWMPPTASYFMLSLLAGNNQMLIVSRPDTTTGRWGVGAILLDQSGKVNTTVLSP